MKREPVASFIAYSIPGTGLEPEADDEGARQGQHDVGHRMVPA